MTTSRGGRHRAAATALGACLLLTACTDTSAPTRTPTPEPTATATPTASPTPTPTTDAAVAPQRPEAMAMASADGAAAAASYAIELLNHGSATGDPSGWSAISAPTCRMCTAFSEDIVVTGPDGSTPLTVTAASGREVTAGQLYSAELTISQPASPDGTTAAGVFVFQFALGYTDDWLVEAIDIHES